jgi:hypothetical protein
MNISTIQKGQVQVPKDFWHSFRLFPFPFDDFAFDHWYIFIVGASLIYLTIDVANIRKNITNPLLTSLGAILVLTVLAFNRWRYSVPKTFQTLLIKELVNSINQSGDIKADYLTFLEDYQRALLSNKRFFMISLSIIIAVGFTFWGEFHYLFPASSHTLLIIQIAGALLKVIIPLSLLGYFFGVAAWAMIISGKSIKDLTSRFDLMIQPGHPDKCGGFRFLGSFCFNMALPLLIGTSYLALYSIRGTLHPILDHGLNLVQLASSTGLIILALPLSAIAFFGSLWSIHNKMMQKKEVYEDEFAVRSAKLELKIQTALDQGKLEEAKSIKEEREILQVLHPDNLDYPEWPFDKRIFLTFVVPQILPFISLMLPLIKS